MAYAGKSIAGRKNPALAAGKGRFAGDVQPAGAHWLVFVRSPFANARIESIDVDEALEVDGVVGVLTGHDLAESTTALHVSSDPETRGKKSLSYYALPTEYVRFAGQVVAAVVARDRFAAHQAAELVDVDYEDFPVVSDPESALEPDSPCAVVEWEDNRLYEKQFHAGDAETAIAGAHGRVAGRASVQRHLPAPIEPRSYVAEWDRFAEKLTVWSSTQMPHTARTVLANVLSLPSPNVRVIQPDVGGGFGTKSPATSEEITVAFAAKKYDCPVRWVEERMEYFQGCGHARETFFEFEAGYSEDGVIDGLKVRVVADIGFPITAWVQSFVTAYCLPAAYQVPDCSIELVSVTTNKCFWAGYRGFGKEVASFLMDRVLDRIADATGVERAKVRLRNFVPSDAFPYSQVSGAVLDSGNYPKAMRRLIEIVDVPAFRQEQVAARAEGRRIGLGFGFELTPEGCSMPHNIVLQGWDGTTVRMDPLGHTTVLTGVTSPGSGNETGIAQIVADTIGVPLDTVHVVQGDTDRCPYGLGNFSSRSLMIGGSAALMAAGDIRDKLFEVAGKMLEVAAEDLEAAEGVISVKGAPTKSVPIRAAAGLIYTHAFGPETEDVEPGLESTRYFRIGNVYHQPEKQGRFSTYPTWPYLACAMVVEVDEETGFVKPLRYYGVHDCGKIINPLLVDAQIHGGVAQGIGAALHERLVYDENGQLLTATFMDYTIPTAVELPPQIELEHQETPSPATPLGTKGAGESGIAGPMSAVASAVEDAFSDRKIQLMDLPVSPDRVWGALQSSKADA